MSATELLFRADAYATDFEAEVLAAEPGRVVLDRTLFYPEGGGQPGDTGVLRLPDGREFKVTDTRKGVESGQVAHVLQDSALLLPTGARLAGRIDWQRRYRLMRMHTCLHLLSAVIVAPVTGGAVGDGYGRLDFDLPESPEREEVEDRLNALIRRDAPVSFRWITDAELDAQPELVKTLSVQPPRGHGQVRLVEVEGIDLQPCGGTHIRRIGEIGRVHIAKVEKKGKQNRRVRLEFPGDGATIN
ncbi:MAG TPA: alanyl-tRNA editing protein [Gammaproteobacteria bacterium]|nr:alanyl-tRNA editing protein [Gammaproteobacteria bacterium]